MRFEEHYITEELLVEITESTTLYHRSHDDLKPGQILNPKDVQKDGKHWLESRQAELELEKVRKEKFSDKPSRFNCVFSSVIPKARFLSKGFLYEIKPIGKIHLTNARIIDEINEIWNRDEGEFEIYGQKIDFNLPRNAYILDRLVNSVKHLFYEYWKPRSYYLSRDQIVHLEVLSDKAQVIRKVEEVEDLNVGDKVEFLKPATGEFFAYQKDGNQPLNDEQIKKLLSNKEIKVKESEKYKNFYLVTFPVGTIAKISRIRKQEKYTRYSLGKYRSLDMEIPGLEFMQFDVTKTKIPGVKYMEMSNWKKYLRKI